MPSSDVSKVHIKKQLNSGNKPSFLLLEAIAALVVASVFAILAFGFFGNISKSSELSKAQTEYQQITFPAQSFYRKDFN